MIRTPEIRSGKVLMPGLIGAAAGALLGVAIMYFLFKSGSDSVSINTVRSEGVQKNEVMVLGRIEPAGGLVPVFGTPGDHIVRFINGSDAVGTQVKKGTRLVEMAGDALRAKETKLAKQQLADAELQQRKIKEVTEARKKEAVQEIENTQRSREAEINAQRSKLEVARLQVQLAETQLDRVRSLTGGSVARSDIAKQELQVQQAQAELKAGADLLRAGEKAFADGKELAKVKLAAAESEAERAVAAVPLETAKLAYETAQLKETFGHITAPVDGKIVRIQSVPGETTSQVKPILQLAANSEELVVRVEIPERDVEPVRAAFGNPVQPLPATITSRGLGSGVELAAVLRSPAHLAQTITRNTVMELAPSTGSDRRVVEAVIEVTETDRDKLARVRDVLGVQVEVTIHLSGKTTATVRK